MKKLMTTIMCALGISMCAFAADTQYKVYDFVVSLKTTKAGGAESTSCGTTYNWRVRGNRKLVGIIAGCGCVAAAGDESCNNFSIYLWDATTKMQLTDFTLKTEILQRIGKKGELVEQFLTLTVNDPDGEKFVLNLSGIGAYKISKKGSNYDTISTSGRVTGLVDAPYLFTKGSNSCCGYNTPDSTDQTTAVMVCEDGICSASDTSDTTVCYGTYTFKYNASKAAKCEKKGITKAALGLPAYVEF